MLPLEFDGLLIDGILLFLLANSGYYCAIFYRGWRVPANGLIHH